MRCSRRTKQFTRTKTGVDASSSPDMTRAANYAFLTAVYHDQLDDCRKLFAEARVDPSTASVDGVNALVVALASR